MKKLTIAIPTFNGGKNLERAIRSCKNIQLSSEDYEILIIDNCSTDDSMSNLDKLKDQFRNLVLIKNKKNVGRIQNWNVCIDNATGKFLIFLFSNDTINEENNIHECIEHLDSDESISIAFFRQSIASSYLLRSINMLPKLFNKLISLGNLVIKSFNIL